MCTGASTLTREIFLSRSMGNNFSSSTQIVVQCEKPHYCGGDTVRGVVAFNCSTQAVHATGIELKVTGYERCKWQDTEVVSNGNKTETRTVTRDADRKFFKVTVPLGPPGLLPPGQYQWGFAFTLPADLPSSFSYHKHDVKADVLYKVKAVIHTAGTFKSKIKGKQHLGLIQREYHTPQAVAKTAATEMTVCCCLKRGFADARVEMSKDRYMPGEQADAILHANNQSSEEFTSVEVKLKQEITLYADGHKKKILNTIVSQSLPGIPKYTTLQGNLARYIPMKLPANLAPTTHGKIINCDYYVSVTLKTGGFVGLFISDLKCRVPLVVYPPQPAGDVFFMEPPPGWAPSQVYPPIPVNVPSAPPLPPDAISGVSFWNKASSIGHTNGQGRT